MDSSFVFERRSNRIHGHGSYIQDYKDGKGLIWERIMELGVDSALLMVAETIAGFELGSDRFSAFNIESWMRPENKEFVCFRFNDSNNTVLAIYQHDFHTWLIRANVDRLMEYELKDGMPNKRLVEFLKGF